VVARTGFCIHPRDAVRAVPKVGGTKDVNLDKLRALRPTHTIVNIDENRKEAVDAMRAFVPHIVVTHPCAPSDNLSLYRLLGGLFGQEAQAEALCEQLQTALDGLQARTWPARKALYCIWQDPWMTVSRDTYISRMLAQVNWRTWPADDDALRAALQTCVGGDCSQPDPRGQRYPAFRWHDALVAEIDLVLLSSEPYRFTEAHCDALEKQIGKPVLLIDGEMVSWYGSRAIDGLRYLGDFARENN
jgi:hypothetical protein